ncbi:putative peptidoglycan muropeptide transporter SLC46 [Brevipalpus obovatus]|uniref:putative peptidoglycan muropeptide transporter SLC46 n=1 Tax=Brevipalpus obovatus TaxID=246614 RepID=UPI003D9F2F1E
MSPNQHSDPPSSVNEAPTSASFSYLKVINLDVFCFLICFVLGFTDISLNQVVQDKICLNDFKLSSKVCSNIQDRKDYLTQAIDIYGQVTLWKSYSSLIDCIPSILVTLFIGKWLDRYPKMMKYVLAAGPFAFFLGNLIVLYQLYYFQIDYMILLLYNIPRMLSGGIAAFLGCVFSLVTKTSPPSHRMIRFGMIDFAISAGILAGMLSGGLVLNLKPWFGHELQNYTGVFLISCVINLFSTFWVLVLINTEESYGGQIDKKSQQNDQNQNQIQGPPTNRKGVGKMFLEIFDTSNVIDMLKTCIKRRSYHKHLYIWASLVSMTIYIFCYLGESTIAYQFAQLAYHWNAVYYSTARAVSLVLPAFMGLILPYILQKCLHWEDAACGILGILSAMFSFIIKGGILKPYVFFLSGIIAAFSSVFAPCVRSMISKSAEPDEVGQIFTLLGCLEAATPIVNGFYYSTVFTATASVYPGFVYHVTVGVLMIPYLTILWMDLDMRRQKKLELKAKRVKAISDDDTSKLIENECLQADGPSCFKE